MTEFSDNQAECLLKFISNKVVHIDYEPAEEQKLIRQITKIVHTDTKFVDFLKIFYSIYAKMTPGTKICIFCLKVISIKQIFETLFLDGVRCDYITGKNKLNERKFTLEKWKQGKFNVLITSDIVFDQEGTAPNYIIHYELPINNETVLTRNSMLLSGGLCIYLISKENYKMTPFFIEV